MRRPDRPEGILSRAMRSARRGAYEGVLFVALLPLIVWGRHVWRMRRPRGRTK